MARIICRPLAVLLLAALLFALGSCAMGDKPGSLPTNSDPPPSPKQTQGPPPSQESVLPSLSVSPLPQSDPPAPTQSDPPAPTQSDPPAPSLGEPSTPSLGWQPFPVPVAEGEDVGNDWFADAVFVGDSRTDGLRLYSGIKGASFICHAGLSVFTVDSNECIKTDDGTKITALDALSRQQWAKVYLTLGINELGYSITSFKSAYTGVVEQIKLLQPGAAIYLQTLIPVNEPIAYKNGTNPAINNEKLKQFNEVIAQIASEQGVNLVDVDTPFWSVEGCLSAENTGDGVHLTRAGYTAWYTYLRTHTGSTVSTVPPPYFPSDYFPSDPSLATETPSLSGGDAWNTETGAYYPQ